MLRSIINEIRLEIDKQCVISIKKNVFKFTV
jgi:hypothetical protein